MTMFGIDAASFQGLVGWAAVDETTGFGWEKVTEGTTYVNPEWAAARAAMALRWKTSGFTPGAYLFLHEGNGAAQAQFFAGHAGDLTGFGLAIDIEPSGTSRPDHATALACERELRQLYPRHPVGGYIPHWYWDGADTTFCDWLWGSSYVSGVGSPRSLYPRVPASYWAPYGGRKPALLQFTSSAVVPGVGGHVDCSAYEGTYAQYRALVAAAVLPPPPPTPPPVPSGADWQATIMGRIPTIRQGSTAAAWVRRAQALLGPAGAAVTVDGAFGPATAAAVKRVQHAHSLAQDGVVGPSTWAVLITGAP
jgi:GH25 family lysozyme M1 (1,4-beta-N-acetylmuramidase)